MTTGCDTTRVARLCAALGYQFEVRACNGWRRAHVQYAGEWHRLHETNGMRLPARRHYADVISDAEAALSDRVKAAVSAAFARVGTEGGYSDRLARMTDRERAILDAFLVDCGAGR